MAEVVPLVKPVQDEELVVVAEVEVGTGIEAVEIDV